MKKYTHDAPKLKGAHRKLRALYKKIPETTGCMENLDTCKSWCCSTQSPQVLYVEFLYVWKDIIKYWTIPDILDLIESAVRSYLNNNPVKGCIFHNKDTGLCMQHKTRCFNCYIYGITPKEEFTKRFNKFKEMYKDRPDVILHDQCPLVSANKKVTQKDIDKWWNELVNIENSIGIKKKNSVARFIDNGKKVIKKEFSIDVDQEIKGIKEDFKNSTGVDLDEVKREVRNVGRKTARKIDEAMCQIL